MTQQLYSWVCIPEKGKTCIHTKICTHMVKVNLLCNSQELEMVQMPFNW